MGKAIVLSESSGNFRHWATQFVNADPNDRGVVEIDPRHIHRTPSATQRMEYVNTYYGNAARRAGRNGVVIVSLGHGGASDTDTTIGMVNLLPNNALRVQSEQLRYGGSDEEQGDVSVLSRAPERRTCRSLLRRFDLDDSTRRPVPPEDHTINYMDCRGAQAARPRQEFQAALARIGELLQVNNVREVVLLTCRVGSAVNYIDRLANNWGVNILAYQKRVAANSDDAAQNPYHIYLLGDEQRLYRQELPNHSGYRAIPSQRLRSVNQ